MDPIHTEAFHHFVDSLLQSSESGALSKMKSETGQLSHWFFPCLEESKRRQIETWFQRQSAWCALMPNDLDVRAALAPGTFPSPPGTQQVPCEQLIDEAIANFRQADIKRTTLATGVAYFHRFLGSIASVVNAANPNFEETASPIGERQVIRSRQAPPGALLPPPPHTLDARACLYQSIDLARCFLDSEKNLEERILADPRNRGRQFSLHEQEMITHRDYLLLVLRYDMLAVTPYHFLNFLADTDFYHSRAFFQPVLSTATNILEAIMRTPLWRDELPSSLTGVALYISLYRVFQREVEEAHIPQSSVPLLRSMQNQLQLMGI